MALRYHWRKLIPAIAFPMLLALGPNHATAQTSQCFGTVNQGSISGSVALPVSGPNFSAYSRLGVAAGRTHVHQKVAEIVVAAYAALATELPDVTFVYGETGWPSGGRIRPHRSHQNGLSVDFFVPLRDSAGKSVPMPTSVTNEFGYGINFDADAKYGDLSIDFPALAELMYQLHRAATARGYGMALVIFDKLYWPKLLATPRGPYLRDQLNFMKGKPWIRHDQHFHVDFAIPCKPG